MFKNYLTVAIRNLMRYRGYSAINIFGLAVGMACCVLIVLFVRDELSYDRFHEKADRIYRVGLEWQFPGDEPVQRMPRTSGPLAQALLQAIPAIEQAVRFLPFHEYGRICVHRGRTPFYEEGGYIADASVSS